MADNPFAKFVTDGGDGDTSTPAAPAAPNPFARFVDPADTATPQPVQRGPVDRHDESQSGGWFHDYVALPFAHFIAGGAKMMIPAAQSELAMAPGITLKDMPQEGDVNKLIFGTPNPVAPNATSRFLGNVAEGIGANPPLALAMPLTTLGGAVAGESAKEAGAGPVLSTGAAIAGGGIGGALENGLMKVLTSVGELSRTAIGSSAKNAASDWLKNGFKAAKDKIDSDLADNIDNASNLRSISPAGPPGSWEKTLDGLFKEAKDAKDELVNEVKGHFEDIANAASPEKAFDLAKDKLDVLRQHLPGLADQVENAKLAHTLPKAEAGAGKVGANVDRLSLGILGELVGHEAVPWVTSQLHSMMTPEAIGLATPLVTTMLAPLMYSGVRRVIGNELTQALRVPALVGGVAGGAGTPPPGSGQ